jgi:hypothetical protein
MPISSLIQELYKKGEKGIKREGEEELNLFRFGEKNSMEEAETIRLNAK